MDNFKQFLAEKSKQRKYLGDGRGAILRFEHFPEPE